MDAVATPSNAVGNSWTPRVGVSFGHAQNKTPSLGVLIRAPWGRREDAVATQWELHQRGGNSAGAPWDRSANAVVAHGVSTEFPRRPRSSHGVSTALIRRVYGVFTACCLSYVAFPWRLQGVVTAFMALAWRFYRVLWRSYDKSTEKDEKDMQILSQKQANHYLNGMHTYMNSSTNFFQYVCRAASWFTTCVYAAFPFSHRFPSSPLTSHAVFVKANVQMSETLFLFCLQAVRAVLERRGSAVRTPRTPRKRSENVVQAPWNATQNSAERSENSVGTPWTRRGRREDAMACFFHK